MEKSPMATELLNDCHYERWDSARKRIIDAPELIWQARDDRKCCVAFCAAVRGNVEMLEFMVSIIRQQPERHHEQLLRETFESSTVNGNFPIHGAAMGDFIEVIKFLLEHCPSGRAILDAKNKHGASAAYFALFFSSVRSAEFILQKSPRGIAIFSDINRKGLTCLDLCTLKVNNYFTPQKIAELGLNNELELIDQCDFCDSRALLSLMLGVIRQDIEVQLYRRQLK